MRTRNDLDNLYRAMGGKRMLRPKSEPSNPYGFQKARVVDIRKWGRV